MQGKGPAPKLQQVSEPCKGAHRRLQQHSTGKPGAATGAATAGASRQQQERLKHRQQQQQDGSSSNGSLGCSSLRNFAPLHPASPLPNTVIHTSTNSCVTRFPHFPQPSDALYQLLRGAHSAGAGAHTPLVHTSAPARHLLHHQPVCVPGQR